MCGFKSIIMINLSILAVIYTGMQIYVGIFSYFEVPNSDNEILTYSQFSTKLDIVGPHMWYN